jgi:hypothetical protein
MAPAEALEMLRPAELPKVTKCVLTNAKFDTAKAAKTFNIEANYAADPVRLQTLAAWSGLKERSAEQLADGLELFALRAVIERDGPFGYVILQRHAAELTERWPVLAEEISERLYMDFGSGNLLLNLRSPPGSAIVDALWELYLSGAVYGFTDYSFGTAVAAAAQAVELNG